ncbi:MAG: NAD(P)-dependent oxidoreductase [Oscillibacter sp.]|nr:NAD(P)-dependent oxidoreductase [Oscillibacter sp.]
MKKILIVGGAGYLGGYMTDVFLDKEDYDVTVYDNLLYESRYLKKVKFIHGDIRDTEKLGKVLPEFDIIVWLAALVGDGACAINTTLTEEINFNATKWMVDHFHGTVIFMSTCSVYGINSELIDETAAPNPLSAYAATKLEAERYVIAHAKDYLIFRLGTLYGVGDAFSRLRLDLVVNILTLRAVRGETLTVFGGQQWRPILHVRDVSHAVEFCLEHGIRGLYNLCERNIVIGELAQEIQKYIPSAKIVWKDMKFEDLRDYRVKNNRILDTGWRPKFSLPEGIEELKRVFEEGRVKDTTDPVYSNANYLKTIHFGENEK